MSRHIANVTWEEKLRLQLDEAQQLITRLTEALGMALTKAPHELDCPSSEYVLRNGVNALRECACWRKAAWSAYDAAVAKERAL